MSAIPTYLLYGESGDGFQADWLHIESIQSRSRLHDYSIRPHRHEQLFQFLHLSAGTAQVALDGEMRLITPPAVVLVPALCVHGYVFSPQVGGTVITLFERDLAGFFDRAPFLASLFAAPRILQLASEANDHLGQALHGLTAAFAQPAASRHLLLQGQISLAFAIIIEACAGADRATRHPTTTRAQQLVAQFRRQIDRDFTAHRPIDSYAAQLGVTQTHLNRVCRLITGESALGLVNRRLVLEAKRLLTFTGLEIKEIAGQIGFEDAAYFTRFFHRQAGQAPSSFRQHAHGNSEIES